MKLEPPNHTCRLPQHVPVNVYSHYGAIVIVRTDGKSLLVQSDVDVEETLRDMTQPDLSPLDYNDLGQAPTEACLPDGYIYCLGDAWQHEID